MPVDAASGPSDGGAPDVGLPPDAALQSVGITVYDDLGAPAAGAPVIVQDADGTVFGEVVTDSAGHAVARVPPGGMLTAAFHPQQDWDLYSLMTFVAVRDGDELIAGSPAAAAGPNGALTITLTDTVAGATSYQVISACTSETFDATNTTVGVSTYAACNPPDGVISAVVVAYAAGTRVGFTAVRDVALSGGSASATAPAFRTDFGQLAGDYQALPSWAWEIEQQVWLDAPGGWIKGDQRAVNVSGMTSATVTSSYAADVADDYAWSWRVTSVGGWVPVVMRRAAVLDAAPVVDVAGVLPAGAHGLALVAGADPARPILTWTSDGDPAAADCAFISVMYGQSLVGGNRYYHWRVALPAGPPPFLLPALPSDVPSWAPDAVGGIEPEMYLIDGDFLAGYDAVRARLHMFPLRLRELLSWVPLDGTLRVSAVGAATLN